MINNLHKSLILTASCVASFSAQAWQLEISEQQPPLKIWTQSVADSDFRAFKGEIMINATVAQVADVITHTEGYPEWYFNSKVAKKLKVINQSQGLTYSISSLPWPVSDRDAVTLSTKSVLANGDIHIQVEARPDLYPIQKDLIRVPKLEGSWKIERTDAQQTKVTLQIAAEPGGSIPSWLANSLVVDMPFYSLSNLKQRVEAAKHN